MTLRDKVAMNNPTCVNEQYRGGVEGCPGNYSYLHNNKRICGKQSEENCRACWSQEFVEEGERDMDAVEYRACENCAAYEKQISNLQDSLEEKRVEIRTLMGVRNQQDKELVELRNTILQYEMVIRAIEAMTGRNIINEFDD